MRSESSLEEPIDESIDVLFVWHAGPNFQVMKLKTAGSDSQVRADCWTLVRSWDLSAVEHG